MKPEKVLSIQNQKLLVGSLLPIKNFHHPLSELDEGQVIQVNQALEELIPTKMNPSDPKSSRESQMELGSGLTVSVKLLELDLMIQTN